jgi:hypothetical protein
MNIRLRLALLGFAVTMSACTGDGGGLLSGCWLCGENLKITIKPTISANVGPDQNVIYGDTVVLAGGVRPYGDADIHAQGVVLEQ